MPEFTETDALGTSCDANPDYVPDLAILGQSADFRQYDLQMIALFRKKYPLAELMVSYSSRDMESVRQSFEARVELKEALEVYESESPSRRR